MASSDTAADAPTSPAPRSRRVLRVFGEIALVVLVFVAVRGWQQRDLVSGPAPALAGLEARAGEPTMVHFWATWCGVCSAVEGSVANLAAEGNVITVASNSGNADEVSAHLKAQGIELPVVNDPGGDIAERFGVSAYPTTFYVDGAGQIRQTEVGYTTELGMRVRLWLASL